MAQNNPESGGRFGWFIAGVAVGAAVGMLYAPKAGKETRGIIGQTSREGREAVQLSGRELVDKGRELYDRGRQIAEDAADLFERGRKLVQG